MADAADDLDLGFSIRNRLIHATFYVPGNTELISAYSWCLARHDEDPERFRLELWFYKWVATALPSYSTITSEQIESVVVDLERRFSAVGASGAPALTARIDRARVEGDLVALEESLTKWLALVRKPGVGLNDCAACDTATHVSALVDLGRGVEALAVASPLVEGHQCCGTQPHFTLGRLLEPSRQLQQHELADRLFSHGYGLIGSDERFLGHVSFYVRDLLGQGDVERALGMIADHLPWLNTPQMDLGRLEFLSAARFAIRQGGLVGLALEVDAELQAALSAASVDALADSLCKEAEALAAKFDERNGRNFRRGILARDDAA